MLLRFPSSDGGAAAAVSDAPSITDHGNPVEREAEDADRSAEYHARAPEPNYSDFKAEYVDNQGREYSLARTGAFLEDQTDVQNGQFDTPPRDSRVTAKRLLLWLRMPVAQRWTTPLPEPDGEKLDLYHVATQVICMAITDGVFMSGPRARTGHVFVRNFASDGQVEDPSLYEPWLRVSKEPGNYMF